MDLDLQVGEIHDRGGRAAGEPAAGLPRVQQQAAAESPLVDRVGVAIDDEVEAAARRERLGQLRIVDDRDAAPRELSAITPIFTAGQSNTAAAAPGFACSRCGSAVQREVERVGSRQGNHVARPTRGEIEGLQHPCADRAG